MTRKAPRAAGAASRPAEFAARVMVPADSAARAVMPAHSVARAVMPGDFAARVVRIVRRIPPGRLATYGDVAAAAGSPRAHRAVGNIMRGCSAPGVPCHRVVAAGGGLGGYGGRLELKRALLRAEGVLVSGTRIRDFAERRLPLDTSRAGRVSR